MISRSSLVPLAVLGSALCLLPAAPSRSDEASAVARIQKLRGRLLRDPKLPGKPVIRVELQATSAGDADLAVLTDLKRLKVLYLGYGTPITDAGLAHLKGLTTLEELYLPETQITDAGLAHLKGLSNLRKLGLVFCKGITDRGLVHLRGLKKLQDVNFSGTQVTERGIAELQKVLPNAYLSGGLANPPATSPAERLEKLKQQESKDVSPEMLDFMSLLDGTEAGVEAAVKKHGTASLDASDILLIRVEQPHVLKTEREGEQTCYTVQVRQGIARGKYRLCWKDRKVQSVKRLAIEFD